MSKHHTWHGMEFLPSVRICCVKNTFILRNTTCYMHNHSLVTSLLWEDSGVSLPKSKGSVGYITGSRTGIYPSGTGSVRRVTWLK
jgi:hypothetical protein